MNEKVKRLKFIRALEKFAKSNISYLKDKNFEYETLKQRVQKSYEKLKDVEPVRLNSAYPVALQNYVNLMLKILNEEKIENFQETLLKEANLLHKEKNKTQYKKDKHKKINY